MVKGFLDLLTVYFLTGYSQRPQHLLGTVGLLAFALGGLGLICLTIQWGVSRLDNVLDNDVLHNDVHLHQRAVFYYSMTALLLGAQFISIGFLAEMMTGFFARDTNSYSIRERTGKE